MCTSTPEERYFGANGIRPTGPLALFIVVLSLFHGMSELPAFAGDRPVFGMNN
jgi:hypothetical protein